MANNGSYNKQKNDFKPKKLPEEYLDNSGYFVLSEDEKEVINRDFIIGFPAEIAQALDEKDKNKSTQIRKFYDYCIRIRDMMTQGKTFEEVEGEFCRLENFAKYSESRGLVTPVFVKFIQKNVNAVYNEQDFYAFIKHFEAVIAHLKSK